jgi:hypothetical protein
MEQQQQQAALKFPQLLDEQFTSTASTKQQQQKERKKGSRAKILQSSFVHISLREIDSTPERSRTKRKVSITLRAEVSPLRAAAAATLLRSTLKEQEGGGKLEGGRWMKYLNLIDYFRTKQISLAHTQ